VSAAEGDNLVLVLLILASLADAALALLLIAVSGFFFGSGPEGMHGELSAVAIWTAGLIACIAAPVAGFVLRRFGRVGLGFAVACIPPIAATFMATL
jgi:hypothetical protein